MDDTNLYIFKLIIISSLNSREVNCSRLTEPAHRKTVGVDVDLVNHSSERLLAKAVKLRSCQGCQIEIGQESPSGVPNLVVLPS